MKHIFPLLLILCLFTSCEKKKESSQAPTKLKPTESKSFDSLPEREQSRIQNYFNDQPESNSYVLTEQCIVYSDTALIKPIATLVFGTPVLNYSGQYEEVGYKIIDSWRHKIMAIRFWDGKDSLNGYTLETNISFFATKTSDGNLILAGFDDYLSNSLTAKLLVVDTLDRVIDKISFPMTGGEKGKDGISYYSYYTEGKITHEHIASGFDDVISIYMYYPACGYMASEQWFNYHSQRILPINECLHMGDAGAAAAWGYLIFPEEKNGEANCILKVMRFEEYEYNEDMQDHKAINPDSSLIRLKWDMNKGVIKADTLYNDFEN